MILLPQDDHEVKLELNMDQYLNKYQTQNNEVNKSTNSIRQMKANDQKTSLSIKK